MTPAARLAAAIEVLDAIIAAACEGGAAADTIVQRYFAARRYAGSKDRRAVRDLVFDVVRRFGEVPESGRAAMIGFARAGAPELLDMFGSGGHAPAALVPGEAEARGGVVPEWLRPQLVARFGDETDAAAGALLERAPIDLRVNAARTTPAALLAAHPELTPIAGLPLGLRAPTGTSVDGWPEHAAGGFEVQDAGSQLAALVVAAKPGELVIDLCAGAGGKTLALAAQMQAKGSISGKLIACDVDRGRLSELPPRLDRAGVQGVEIRLMDGGREWAALHNRADSADAVLVDAPCSGSGTWRRNPEARWRLTPVRLDRLMATQDRLLALAARLVRPGGRLVFVTCSVLPDEGEARVAHFLADHPQFRAGEVRALAPHRDGCDGFFIASLFRN